MILIFINKVQINKRVLVIVCIVFYFSYNFIQIATFVFAGSRCVYVTVIVTPPGVNQ